MSGERDATVALSRQDTITLQDTSVGGLWLFRGNQVLTGFLPAFLKFLQRLLDFPQVAWAALHEIVEATTDFHVFRLWYTRLYRKWCTGYG